jgi:outer membrane immunogenic protein
MVFCGAGAKLQSGICFGLRESLQGEAMRILFAFLTLLAFVPLTAAAADPILPLPAGVPGWTGFYLSAGAGYGTWTGDSTTTFPGTTTCFICVPITQSGKGYFGTVGGGYDHQFTPRMGMFHPNLVAGVFADTNLGSLSGTLQDQDPFFVGTTTENWSWAVGARLGWLPVPQALTYVNAGYTQARFSGANMAFTGLLSGFPAGTFSGFSTPGFSAGGWFVGGGVETTLAPFLPAGWFLRTEYRYADYGTTSLADTCTTGCLPAFLAGTIAFHPTVQTVSTELIYKFNWSGPLGDPGVVTVVAATPPGVFKSPPPVSPIDIWTGFYLEGGGGYGMWNADTTTISPTTGVCVLCATQTQGGKGGFGTAGGGYDYQFGAQIGPFHPQLVAGVFADANLSNLMGSVQDQNPFFTGTTTEKWSWAVGARGGVLVSSQVFSYANAGYTQAHFTGASMVSTIAPAGAASGFSTPAFSVGGWFVGGGVETGLGSVLWPGWFLRSEYRYAYYGTANLPDTCAGVSGSAACLFTPSPQATITFHPTVQTISAALVYKFNWLAGR